MRAQDGEGVRWRDSDPFHLHHSITPSTTSLPRQRGTGGPDGGGGGGVGSPPSVSRQNSNGSTSSAMAIQSLASEGDNPESSRLENELLKEELQQVGLLVLRSSTE